LFVLFNGNYIPVGTNRDFGLKHLILGSLFCVAWGKPKRYFMAIVEGAVEIGGKPFPIPARDEAQSARALEIEKSFLPIIEFYKAHFLDTDIIYLTWVEEEYTSGRPYIRIYSPTIDELPLLSIWDKHKPVAPAQPS
jgi:hypothetical protein